MELVVSHAAALSLANHVGRRWNRQKEPLWRSRRKRSHLAAEHLCAALEWLTFLPWMLLLLLLLVRLLLAVV
jgi:hypothetical protein